TGVYSNAGIMIAGHIAEHAAGKPWEELMQSLLFDPLQMTTAGFGSPGFPDELAALRGHQRQDRKLVAIEPGAGSDNPSFLGPAGTVHASLADWAKYLQLHLRGATADQKVGAITLRKETFARLHTAYPMAAGDSFGYGYGWLITKRDWAAGDGKVLTHNGSNGLWLATCWLDPVGGFGVIACCNAGDAGAAAANDAAVGLAANERLDARTKARAAKSSGGPSP
ncbi:MAG: class A beta-lactamase-related serine hydrolase, partial [Planctomycetes bacterium]|nr:class A beta-lactamase-related serine hydrolase [Planctomycetota bacterium]